MVWEGCVGTGLAVTLNHHLWSSQCLCERYQVLLVAARHGRDQRNAATWHRSFKSFINKQSKTSQFPPSSARSLCLFFSRRIEDIGIWRLRVARGLFCVSRLREADRCRGFHPGQKQLLLCAVLRGQVCSSVQPLQKGEPGLACNMTDADHKHFSIKRPSQVPRARGSIFKSPVLSRKCPKPKIFNLQWHLTEKSFKNSNLTNWSQRLWCSFLTNDLNY